MNNLLHEVENAGNVYSMGFMLKEARKRANLTQEELADKIGTKRSYISRIERDASSVRLSTLVKIIEDGLGGQLQIQIVV